MFSFNIKASRSTCDGNIGWHNNLSFELRLYSTLTNTYYTVSLPDGRLYRFYSIDIPLSGTIIRPLSTIEDVNYSELTYEGADGSGIRISTAHNDIMYDIWVKFIASQGLIDKMINSFRFET